jgi:DegV family protein with EDD domain
MPIKIVTDSTCDLPTSVIQEYDITVVPVYINIGNLSYLDGVNLTRSDFYKQLPQCKIPPTTSAPGIGSFIETYEKLAAEKGIEIISIHMAGEFSNIINVTRLAAQAVKNIKISIIDSKSTSLGLGFLALIAAKAARAGNSTAEIISLIEQRIIHTYVFAALDTIEYLHRSGRASTLQASLGSLLKIKPVLTLTNGTLALDNIRTHARAVEHLISRVAALGSLEYLAIAHSHAIDQAEILYQKVMNLFPKIDKPMMIEVTPAIGTHIGPGAVGLLCVQEV